MIAEGIDGSSDGGGRDLTADAMRAAAEHLSAAYPVEVHAVRIPEGDTLVEGFMVWTGPVEVSGTVEWRGRSFYVPVRRRHGDGGPWQEVQSVAAAAAEVGATVRGMNTPSGPDGA